MKAAKKIRAMLAAFLPLLVWSCGSGPSDELYRSTRFLMGTLVEVTVSGPKDRAKADSEAIFNEMKRVEDLASFHKPSALAKVNASSGGPPVKTDPELLKLIREALNIARETGGAYDPTVGAVTRLWNFSGGEPRLPSQVEIDQALAKVGWERVKIDESAGTVELPAAGMALDLGGIAKGYSLDRAREVIKSLDIKAALVNAGGDIVAVGEKAPGKPWRVGVQDPRNPTGMIAVANLKDKVIVTSGDYERCFVQNGKRYHHILDPKSGYPATGMQSVTIVGNSGVECEPRGTSAFVLGAEKGLKYVGSIPGLEALLIDAQGQTHKSPGIDTYLEHVK